MRPAPTAPQGSEAVRRRLDIAQALTRFRGARPMPWWPPAVTGCRGPGSAPAAGPRSPLGNPET